jgi:hypothetical protein
MGEHTYIFDMLVESFWPRVLHLWCSEIVEVGCVTKERTAVERRWKF